MESKNSAGWCRWKHAAIKAVSPWANKTYRWYQNHCRMSGSENTLNTVVLNDRACFHYTDLNSFWIIMLRHMYKNTKLQRAGYHSSCGLKGKCKCTFESDVKRACFLTFSDVISDTKISCFLQALVFIPRTLDLFFACWFSPELQKHSPN